MGRSHAARAAYKSAIGDLYSGVTELGLSPIHCGYEIISADRKAVRPLRKAAETGRSRADMIEQAQRAASAAQAPPLAGRIGQSPIHCGYEIISADRKAVRPLRKAAETGRSRADMIEQAQRAASAAQAPPLAGRIGQSPIHCGYYIIMRKESFTNSNNFQKIP